MILSQKSLTVNSKISTAQFSEFKNSTVCAVGVIIIELFKVGFTGLYVFFDCLGFSGVNEFVYRCYDKD